MKKLFSFGVLLVALFLLSACESGNEETEALQQEIEQMQQAIESIQLVLSDKSATITELEEDLQALESRIYDGQVTFSVTTDDGLMARNVLFKESEEKTTFELLNEAYDIEYTEFDFGIMIDSVEGLESLPGSFIQISKNNTPLEVGISDVSYEAGDHFHFERMWYDGDAQMVYETLELFLTNHVDDFINPESLDMNVVLGLYHLDALEDYMVEVSEEDLKGDVSGLMNAILMNRALGESTDDLKALLDEEPLPSHIYPASLYLLALNADDESLREDYLDKVDALDLESTGHDSLVLSALALSMLGTQEALTLKDELVDHVSNNPTDHLYGENATSYAWVLMLYGYEAIALEEGFESGTMLDTIFEYHDDNGAFYYTLESEDPDLMFTTPQMFLALSYYYSTVESTATHPFMIGE